MKSLAYILALLAMGAALAAVVLGAPGGDAEGAAGDGRPGYIGVLLGPVPEALAGHIGVSAERAMLVRNVMVGSPADEAGLQRYDVIVGFDGSPVRGYDDFVEAVQAAGSGAGVELDFIRAGVPRRAQLTLAAPPADVDGAEWKYELETPADEGFGRRTYRLPPGGRHWQEIPFGQGPLEEFMERFFSEPPGGLRGDLQSVEVTIDGDPDDPNTAVIVRAGDETHRVTGGTLDELPEPYREPARDALESARYSSRDGGTFHFKVPRDEAGPVFRWRFGPPQPHQERREGTPFGPSDPFEDLERRLEELPRRFRETPRAPRSPDRRIEQI